LIPEAEGPGSLARTYVGLVDALKERRADGTALAGTFDHKQTVVDLSGLVHELGKMLEPGEDVDEVAGRCHTTNDSVRAWRRRFEAEGTPGVGRIAQERGRRSWISEGMVAAVVHDRLHATPDDGSTHWTTRTMAKRLGVGKDTVARIWRDHELKRWKSETFRISNDPAFEEKLFSISSGPT
jgi:transposase